MEILSLLNIWTPFEAYVSAAVPSHYHELVGPSQELYVLIGPSTEYYEVEGPSQQLYVLYGCRE